MTHGAVTCLDCGTEFVRPSGYQGNYCPDCHRARVRDSDDPTPPPEPRPLRRDATPSIRQQDDDDADAPSRYDAE